MCWATLARYREQPVSVHKEASDVHPWTLAHGRRPHGRVDGARRDHQRARQRVLRVDSKRWASRLNQVLDADDPQAACADLQRIFTNSAAQLTAVPVI